MSRFTSRFHKGMTVTFNNKQLIIVDIVKGGKTNQPNLHSGMLFTGFKSKPRVYILSDGSRVRGSTLIKQQNQNNDQISNQNTP